MENALAQGGAFARWTSTGARRVGCQTLLIEQVLLPADVASVVILDDDCPVGTRLFTSRLAYRSVSGDNPTRAVASEHIGAGVGRIGKDAKNPRMGQSAPEKFAVPRAAIRATLKPLLGRVPFSI